MNHILTWIPNGCKDNKMTTWAWWIRLHMVTWCLQQLMTMTMTMSTGEETCKFEITFLCVTSHPPSCATLPLKWLFSLQLHFQVSGFNSLNLLKLFNWTILFIFSGLFSDAVNCRDCIAFMTDDWMHECVRSTGAMKLTKENEVLEKKPVPVILCPPQIPHELEWDRTLSS